MTQIDALLVGLGVIGLMTLTVAMAARLISPMRFAQATGGGFGGLGAAKLALVLWGGLHG